MRISSKSMLHFFNPIYFFKHFWRHKNLIRQLVKRDFQLKYRGSIFGILWSILNPLLMLTVYSFVFSVVFKARWGENTSNQLEFAIILFSGLILFTIFSESLNKSPTIIISNTNFVKKVVFPLEILPFVNLISSLIQAFISTVILLISVNLFLDLSKWQALLALVSVVPLLMFSLGLSFFIAAIGVYIRDIAYSVAIITNILIYLTPVFYPIHAVPEFIRPFMYLNPLTIMVENFRGSIIWSNLPNWSDLLIVTVISYFVMVSGLILFKKLESGFSDVL